MAQKVAFCFLITDAIYHEKIWLQFFQGIDPSLYTIYIHYKENLCIKNNFFKPFILTNCIPTKYEDYTIPLAYNILFNEAYKDELNVKFVIVSGSCIPMKPFSYIYDRLTQTPFGYFTVCPDVPNKSHNWFILNRNLIPILCSVEADNELKTLYRDVYAPAEYFYYRKIVEMELLHEVVCVSNVLDQTTFTLWTAKGLTHFTIMNPSLLQQLMQSPNTLFARKCTKAFRPPPNYIQHITTI